MGIESRSQRIKRQKRQRKDSFDQLSSLNCTRSASALVAPPVGHHDRLQGAAGVGSDSFLRISTLKWCFLRFLRVGWALAGSATCRSVVTSSAVAATPSLSRECSVVGSGRAGHRRPLCRSLDERKRGDLATNLYLRIRN